MSVLSAKGHEWINDLDSVMMLRKSIEKVIFIFSIHQILTSELVRLYTYQSCVANTKMQALKVLCN